MEHADNPYSIRPYRRADRQAVRDICAATCWLGEYRPDVIGDDWLWAEYWTRYFTDCRRDYLWVATDRRGRVVGYLTGTPDVSEFNRYLPRLLPGVIARIIRRRLISNPVSRRAIFSFVRSALRGEARLPAAVRRECPAAWHFNLLPEARRRRLGSTMLAMFTDRLRQAGAGGLHAQVISCNAASIASCRRLGMRLVDTSPMTAFAHAIPQPLELHTYVMAV